MFIQSVRRIRSRPKALRDQQNGRFRANHGPAIAWFRNEHELAMGLWVGSVWVGHGAAKSSTFRELTLPKGQGWVTCPNIYQPWSHDDRQLVLQTDKAVGLISIRTGRWLKVPRIQYAAAAVLSPTQPLLFVSSYETSQNAAFFRVRRGAVEQLDHFSIVAPDAYQDSYAGWLPDGRRLLVLEQSLKGRPRLSIYAPDNPNPIASVTFDPAEIVPYNESLTAKLKPTSDCLILREGWWATGILLHHWGEVFFDRNQPALYASILRPTGRPFRKDNKLMCKVNTVWIRAVLNCD
jgi:hypothetical protein